jgi:hypothetical protein
MCAGEDVESQFGSSNGVSTVADIAMVTQVFPSKESGRDGNGNGAGVSYQGKGRSL